jgi:hypothetical protein
MTNARNEIDGVEIGVPIAAPGDEYLGGGGRRGTSDNGRFGHNGGSDGGGAMAEDNDAATDMDEETSRQLASLVPIQRAGDIAVSLSIPALASPDGHHTSNNGQVGTFSGSTMVHIDNTAMMVLVNGTLVTGAANPNSNAQYLLDVQFYGMSSAAARICRLSMLDVIFVFILSTKQVCIWYPRTQAKGVH